MSEVTCPNCKEKFSLTAAGYADIAIQVRDSEFKNEDFIDHNEVSKNQESVKTLKKEVDMCNDSMLNFYKWIKEKGTDIKIVSRLNESPSEIERVEI